MRRLEKVEHSDASSWLWLVDAARIAGDEELATRIERRLFEQGGLNVERIPELASRILIEEGPEDVLAMGELAVRDTLHPDLLTQLVAAARALDAPFQEMRWRMLEQSAELCADGLKQLEKERRERLKKEKAEKDKKGARRAG